MEGYLGQVHMSKVKVTRSKNVHWDVPLTSDNIVLMDLPMKKLRNATWGVFKAYAVFTPNVSDVMGVIVLTSFECVCVCVCVRLAIPAERTDIQT